MSISSSTTFSSNSNQGTLFQKDGMKQKIRTIGRWRIGETLGKGGYSWVKKGHDKKTGKCVALKFMRKADNSWAKEQNKQVVTEIECLKQIKHVNVLKLYAYNLNAKYPSSESKKVDTILLVLEYAPAGEIFDILYYTHAFETILARTYFRQAIFGLEACHMASIAHRDIKPQNLLLDSRFNLKICDFGLSKIFESDADSIMNTSYIGTQGYQAPELIAKKPYDFSCDIFSLGVVLFILINGYPPFEEASVNDQWFKPLANGDVKKFWKLHKQCEIRKDENCKDLLSRMLCFDPKKRITIQQIKKHPWFNMKFLHGKNLIHALRVRHKHMQLKRYQDAEKAVELQTSIPLNRSIKFDENKVECDLYPESLIEGVNDNEQYSTIYWKDILSTFEAFVGNSNGITKFDQLTNTLHCQLLIMNNLQKNGTQVTFDVILYESRQYKLSNEQLNDVDNGKKVYIVKLKKWDGKYDMWTNVRNRMLISCQKAVTGLPNWAKKQRDQKLNEINKEKKIDESKEEDENNQSDDYLVNEKINWDE